LITKKINKGVFLMADTRFTALGMSGSGKTCYVLGMYYEMCVGVRGFTLITTNQTATKLENWMDILDDKTGQGRFPAGTTPTEVSDYSFKLSYQNQGIMSFDWADYGGGTLRDRENNPEVFAKLGKSIEESTALYIFIDGELLCGDDKETKIKNVKRKCARTINSYINSFAEAHDEILPPIVFVVTKADLCGQYLRNGEMKDILKEAFSSVFGKDITTYVVAVSLGKDIADDDYSGEVEPINIHIPFFIGIFHEFLNYCYYLKNAIQRDEAENRDLISRSNNTIAYENSRWFFTDNDRIDRCRQQIQEANESIENNRELLKKYRRLLGAVATELTRVSSNFVVFEDGKEVTFSPEDIYEI